MGFKIQKTPQLIEVLDAMIADDRWHVIAEPADLPDWSEGLTKTAKRLDRGTGANKYLSSIMGLQVWLRGMSPYTGSNVNPREWMYFSYSRATGLVGSIRDVQAAIQGLPCSVAAQLAYASANAGITREWLQNLRNYVNNGTPMPFIHALTYPGTQYVAALPRLV